MQNTIKGIKKQIHARTCYFVTDQLAAVDISNAGKQRSNVILRHRLRKIVDNQVGQHNAVTLVTVRIAAVVQYGLLPSVLSYLIHSGRTPSLMDSHTLENTEEQNTLQLKVRKLTTLRNIIECERPQIFCGYRVIKIRIIKEDCLAHKLNKDDAMDRSKWRKLIKDVR